MVRGPAAILAGGLSRRMGADKALLPWGGGTLAGAVRDRLAAQAAPVAVAGGNADALAVLGLPVLPDAWPGRPGPLAGILAAMEWAAGLGAAAVLTAPCDAPFLPPDLAARLGAGPLPAVAASGGRRHPVVGLWPVAMAGEVRAALAAGTRRVGDVAGAARAVAWDAGPPDPFGNVNTPEDLRAARGWLS